MKWVVLILSVSNLLLAISHLFHLWTHRLTDREFISPSNSGDA